MHHSRHPQYHVTKYERVKGAFVHHYRSLALGVGLVADIWTALCQLLGPRVPEVWRNNKGKLIKSVLTTLVALIGVVLAGFFFKTNMARYWQFHMEAARPPAFDGFDPSCPPTFIEATCPAMLRIPPRLYERLLEPSSAVTRYYRRSRVCWSVEKAWMHPGYASGELDHDFFVAVNEMMQRCADEMSKGRGYPRVVGETEWQLADTEVQQSGLWNVSTWDPLSFRGAAFPRRQTDCQCTMDEAVGAYLRAPFVFWEYPPLPRTLDEAVDFCHCNMAIAWQPYAHLFDLSFESGLPWWGELRMALGWLALTWNVSYPSVLADILPQPVLHGFRAENLPPRGIHDFWQSGLYAGLPDNHGSVPRVLTDQLRRWGRNGVNRDSQREAQRHDMTPLEQWRCVRQGWCFWKDFDYGSELEGEMYVSALLDEVLE